MTAGRTNHTQFASAPKEELCTKCGGSGEVMAMTTWGHGPDDYEYPACCAKCDGTGMQPPPSISFTFFNAWPQCKTKMACNQQKKCLSGCSTICGVIFNNPTKKEL